MGHDSPQNGSMTSHGQNHPRPAKRPAQYESRASPEGTTNPSYPSAQNMAPVPQDPLAKRRRISKDMGQQQGIGVDNPQAVSPDVTASPGLNHGFSSASPQLPASRSFDSQKPANSRPPSVAMGSGQGLPQQQPQHQLHQSQPPPQRFYAQQSQHQSPNMGTADQRHHGPISTTAPPRPRSQMAGAYGAQRHAHLSPQMLYAQQQSPVANQLGSLSHHSSSLGRGMSAGHHQGHHQYPQNMGRQNSTGGGAPGIPQQRSVAAIRGHLPREGAGQAHGFAGHHPQQATSQPNAMGSFHSYNEHSYLNMDYGLTERDVQEAAAVTALGSPSQLEAALSQPKMRDQHMFQSIGRQ
ncbi:hypothetical protein CDD83_10443 [Cordyceps sp. RAO-2017]|nr:hypothetical protein CDD83_10443 [Cordyceps sp. RAO-2017]